MGLSLFRAFLVTNAFNIATENPVTSIPYRFSVYPVNKCPRNKNEFQAAAQRRNCSRGLRYLCAPNKYLSSLIEFCTDRKRGLYEKDNCVLLEGTGDLNHFSCVEKFNSSCPSEPYYDEEIYIYSACLEIDKDLRCFVADKDCMERQFPSTETHINSSKMEWIAIMYIIALLSAGIILSWVIFRKRDEGKKTDSKDNEEMVSLLKNTQDNTSTQIDEKTLRKFLGGEKLTVCHVRCIIVGCAKAGKTTLLKRLQNISFEELEKADIPRTDLVDVHVNSFDVLAEENTIQSVKENDRLPAVVITADNLKHVKTQENAGNKCKYDEENGDISEIDAHSIHNKETAVKQKIEQNEVSDDNEKSVAKPPSQNITTNSKHISSEIMYEGEEANVDSDSGDDDNEKYAISKIMDAVRMLKNETDLHPRITFLDFAGQSMYYAFHQIFLSPKSCSILVVDMTKSLDAKVDVSDTDEKCCSLFESWTYRDHYMFWLKSIDSFGDTKTPVLVVGTHADQLSEKDGREFFKDFFSSVNFDHHSHLNRHLNEDRRKFIIGFPEKGKELEDLKDIKRCLAELVQDSRHLKENIRPVCAIFEQILIRQKKNKIISRKTLSNYKDKLSTQKFRIDGDEISEMLAFFHRNGTLLYFNEDYLKDKIILDIQWFLDAFKCIINYPLEIDGCDSKRKRFYYNGELEDKELNRIWRTCSNEGKEYLHHKTTILAYMEHLGLLTACMSHNQHPFIPIWYYVPCMNKKKFNKTGEEFSKSSILCFKFDDEGKLPIHVFYSIVFKCLKIPDWSILTEKDEICMYDDAACFSLKEHIVVLCICKFQIQVQVWWFPGEEDLKLLEGIKESVETILKVHTKYSYKVGYKCKNGVLSAEADKSFIEESEFPVSNVLCRTCDVDMKHPVSNDRCWVQKSENLKNQAEENKKCDEILSQRIAAMDISEVYESYTYSGGLASLKDIFFVAAIDFGTSFSGYAFAIRVEKEKDSSTIYVPNWYASDAGLITFKIPTTILLDKDEQFVDFGFEAEFTYAELLENGKHEDYFYFCHFQMMFNNLAKMKRLTRDSKVSDIRGRELSAVKIFACAIKYFKDYMLEDLKRRHFGSSETDEIHWVFTVPVIWDDRAKMFMQKAAQEAGIPSNQLIIALEPEAASIYCKHLPAEKLIGGNEISVFRAGSKYLVLDAGGENVDITIHEVQQNGQLKELYQSSSGDCGGTSVDKAFKNALTGIVTERMLKDYSKKYPDDYLSLLKNFEATKRRCRKGQNYHPVCILNLPFSFIEECLETLGTDLKTLISNSKFKDQISLELDKMKIELKLFETFFRPACSGIIKQLKVLLRDVNIIFMVGGFSESYILQNSIRDAFPKCQVIVPEEPSLAILRGAVMLGYYQQNTTSHIA